MILSNPSAGKSKKLDSALAFSWERSCAAVLTQMSLLARHSSVNELSVRLGFHDAEMTECLLCECHLKETNRTRKSLCGT